MKYAKSNDSIRNINLSVLYAKIENGVKSLEGVNKESLKVLFNSSKVRVEFDDEKVSIEDIENVIDKLGYEVLKSQVKKNLKWRIS